MSKLKKALDKAKEARDKVEEPSKPAVETGLPADSPQLPPALAKQRSKPLYRKDTASAATAVEEPVEQPEAKEVAPVYRETKVVGLEQAWLEKNKVVTLSKNSETADRIKILRAQIFKKMVEAGGNSLLITSARPGEGKTWTAVNLAISIAQEFSRTTLLVDADLRRPMIHKVLGLNVEKGLSDYLLGEAKLSELLINPGIEKLTVLPGGRPFPDSTELLGAPKMKSLIQELKGRYPDRFIIFDSTSVLTRADPTVFSQYIDGILLVVEAEHTTSKHIQRALDLLKGKPIMGVMFNKAKDVEN